MTTKKTPAPVADEGKVIASTDGAKLVLQDTTVTEGPVQKAGEKGPPSSLETGVGSPSGEGATKAKTQTYSVQKHDDENGLQVEYVDAESGDEAAQKVLAAAKYKGTSIRGVDVASAPDANSHGGERDASIMIANAENGPLSFDPLGTEANRKATEELGKADIEELGE